MIQCKKDLFAMAKDYRRWCPLRFADKCQIDGSLCAEVKDHFADASKMINGDKTTLEKVQEHILSKRVQTAIAVLPITAAKEGPEEAAKEAIKYADALINEFFKQCPGSINEDLYDKVLEEFDKCGGDFSKLIRR